MKNVLIVDDETRLTSTLIAGLETFYAQGYSFLSAPNGQEAIRILKSKTINIVITDLKMPVMNGFKLLVYMRSHFASTPVIVLSAYGTKEIEVRLNKLGCFKFMAKPVSFKELADAIKEGLKKHTVGGGIVQNISVAGFLQLIEMEYKTCMVEVRCKNTGREGSFYFEKGSLYEAVCGDYNGASAARTIIAWEDVEIKFDDRPNFKFKKRINTQLITLLLDAMKQKDESSDSMQRLGKVVEFDAIADEISKKNDHFDDSHSYDAQTDVTETDADNSYDAQTDVTETDADNSYDAQTDVTETDSDNSYDAQTDVTETDSDNTENYKNNTDQIMKEPDMNVQKLNQAVETMKKDLGEGLLATDIWMVADGVSIAAYNPQPKATALFNQLTSYIADTLSDSGFPGLGKYYLLDLVDNNMVIILPMGEYRWGMMVDSAKIQLGLLLNIVIPKIIDAFEEAVTD